MNRDNVRLHTLAHQDGVYKKKLLEEDLAGLAGLCQNVAHNPSANREQSDTAHALRLEWGRHRRDSHQDGDKVEAEGSLKKRMLEFLVALPSWMSYGL